MPLSNSVKKLTPQQVEERLVQNPHLLLLDVREPAEWREQRIPGSLLIPLNTLPSHLEELDASRETVVLCAHGIRSNMAAEMLAKQAGFTDVANMMGGLAAWKGLLERGEENA